MLTADDLVTTTSLMSELLAEVDADDWGRPTPCDGWSVGVLADHVVNNARFFASAAGAPEHPPVAVDAASAHAAYREAAAALRDAFASPGIADSELATPFGTFPASVVLAVATADQLTHCWDLARPIGRDLDIDAALADRAIATWATFRSVLPPDAGLFGPEVTPSGDVSALDRVAAAAGRRP